MKKEFPADAADGRRFTQIIGVMWFLGGAKK